MSRKRSVLEFIEDVIAAGERAQRHVSGMSHGQFLADEKTRDAVRICLSDIGEAARRAMTLDPSLATEFPAFEADAAYAMRNILTHGYFHVDADIMWGTVQTDVPKIIADARHILSRRGPDAKSKT
jgi:uncharacterized protein with HEPN domain